MKEKPPCPRLEFFWRKTGKTWGERECDYNLVIPLRKYDIRRENKDEEDVRDEHKVTFSTTKVSSGGQDKPIRGDGEVDIPFRDFAHAQWDNMALGGHLPIVSICGNYWTVVKFDN